MHAAAWGAWVGMVMVLALVTTNPLYLAIILLGVVLVAVLAPRTGTGITSFRALALFGVSMFAISLVIATINGNYGDHILFTVPGPEVPSWLGGLRLGGPVSAEGLAAAAIRGMAILAILLAFGVFNGAVSPQRVLRSTPAALFQASLVVTVGLTLLPASIEDLRRVREMRALRGASGGLRDLPSLVVPAVIGGLERSMRLAEAMEARGYGAAPPLPARARLAAAGRLDGEVIRADELGRLGLFGLLLPVAAGTEAGLSDLRARLEGFATSVLGALEERDRRRHSQLVATLDAWLRHGGALAPTADALGIHRNTLAYRLHRVSEVTGYELDDPQTRFTLQLALDLRTLLAAAG